MDKLWKLLGWQPTRGTLAGAVLVIGGISLTSIDWRFLVLTALGTFGPGILREMGLLNDQDEFQREASRRAAYHAFLLAGLVAFLMVTYNRSVETIAYQADEAVELILAVLWFTWFFSSILSYWGPAKTVTRLLVAFGLFWFLFVFASHITEPMALLMESLVVLPFFILAWLAKRWPRIAGTILLLVAMFCFYLFRLYEIVGPDPLGRGRGFVIVFFFAPLFVSGILLLKTPIANSLSANTTEGEG
jgi:hypothetical protein